MQTIAYRRIVEGAIRMLGLNPSDLNPSLFRRLAESITTRTAEGWRRDWWPDWLQVEERTADADRFISNTQANELVIDRIASVTRRDPRQNRLNAWAVGYALGNGGIYLDADEPTDVWIAFQTPPPMFTDAPWSAATAYLTGDVVYLSATQQCYLALTASTGANPATDAVAWRVQLFPALLASFVKRAALADVLTSEKQEDRALRELDLAYQDLERTVTQHFPDQGAFHTVAVRGYGSQ